MTTSPALTARLWSRGFCAVLAAQFLSAMADNALLFGALALLHLRHFPDWSAPLLQEFFVGAYILLAPIAGPVADGLPKGRAMLLSNGLKLLGALGMCAGLNPFLAYALVGAGAATYSPAKYGILAELTDPQHLVQANGVLESSTIAAILAGAILGGVVADHSVAGTLALVALCYGLAALANLLIPKLRAAHPLDRLSPRRLLADFASSIRIVLRHPDTRFSIAGTSLFWGAGATLRLLLVAWVPVALHVAGNAVPAYLNGTVAIGIVFGAALAGKIVTLERSERALPAGVLIGVGVCLLAGTHLLNTALLLTTVIGACGGFFIVPLNALLQERGRESVGSGHAIAVQNLLENTAILAVMGLYTVAVRAEAPVSEIAIGFGVSLSLAIAMLWVLRRRHLAVVALENA